MWRNTPPSVEEVIDCAWWWNYSLHMVHIMQLAVRDGVIVYCASSSRVFNPTEWGGVWAPCIPYPRKPR